MSKASKSIRLNDGSSIPSVGFGCFMISDEAIDQVIEWATEAGYRYFDAATRYENEKSVGRALRKSRVPREELYVVSKIWPSCYDEPARYIDYSLEELNLHYIDAYYLHWPSSSADRRYRAWEELLKYQQKGLITSVGVSNFTQDQLEALISKFGVIPVTNQIEMHPWYPQNELFDWCRDHDISVTAWGPLYRGGFAQPECLINLSQKYGKSVAQIILRWHLQRGATIIPKSTKRDRIFENIDLFDFDLTEYDMKCIDALNDGSHFSSDPNTNNGENFVVNTGREF